jgi:copper chaperone CopZ
MNLKPQFSFITIIAIAASMILSTTAWNQSASPRQKNTKDTIPKKSEKKIRDLDEAIEELERGSMQLEKEMSAKEWEKIEKEISQSIKEIDFDKIKVEVDKALKEVDVAKIQAEVEKSLKDIDIAEINVQVENAIKDVDMVKIQADIEKSLNEVNVAKIKVEVDASLAKVDMENIRKEIERIKETDFEKIEIELQKIKPEIEKSMKEAKAGIEKAKIELKEYKTFVDGLEKDGLIDKKATYTLEHKNGVLKINGKTQPTDVYSKYRNFLEKHKDFTLKKDDDDFIIDID